MRVLYVIPSLSRIWGGVTTVISELIPYLIKKEVNISIFTTTAGARTGRAGAGTDIQFEGVPVRAYSTDFFTNIWLGHSWDLRKALPYSLQDFDLVHIHEIWHYPAYIAAREALRRRKPYLITVHGELEPWALKYKGLKKQIYFQFVQKRQLNSAAVIQCLTGDEAFQVRKYGVTSQISVIPNGVSITNREPPLTKDEFGAKFPRLKDKRIILFLGRIHRIKGLDLLIDAFQRVVQKYRDTVQLVIAGSDDGYKANLYKFATGFGVEAQVFFTGPVYGRDKYLLLTGADVFILPSYSEGFSTAILEAMSSGTPVIISDQCHFPEIGPQKAGFVVPTGVNQIYEALDRLLADSELRRAMGVHGQELVQAKYTWESVAEQLSDLYRKILLNSEYL